ncbi:MAG: hypothetical protein AABX51_04860 [Nanoarchaeota archaeon]|mgnify:CR=1 FL=1
MFYSGPINLDFSIRYSSGEGRAYLTRHIANTADRTIPSVTGRIGDITRNLAAIIIAESRIFDYRGQPEVTEIDGFPRDELRRVVKQLTRQNIKVSPLEEAVDKQLVPAFIPAVAYR